ncbi:MAG: hypothetical protein VYB17_02065 [Candidatus Thermoplasmatota archaeon]|nr:hypothetical protein [Candidatus Thermoplasmatota archaeon]
MRSTRMRVVLCVIALLTISSIPIQAQEVPAPAGWEMGFVYENGASEDDPFPLEEEETTIRFWIRNDNVVGEIEIALEYDEIEIGYNNHATATIEGEESVTVGSGSNDTFVLKITDIPVWEIEGRTTAEFGIEGDLIAFQGVPSPVPLSSQSIESEVIVPQLYRWEVDIQHITHPVNAGTEFNLEVVFNNRGNFPDTITSASIEDDCPVLTVDEDALDSVVGQSEPPIDVWIAMADGSYTKRIDSQIEATFVFDASSTHPTRICEIEITVRSAGAAGGGMGDTSNEGETEVEVEARPVGAQQDQDDASTDDEDGPQNQDQVTSDNFLMFPTMLTPMAILWAALMRAREE